jgi:hypothetical protein
MPGVRGLSGLLYLRTQHPTPKPQNPTLYL